mmetsp:Transcript_22504/g.53612  ORF Transcript_22504/g.53612 Transcript_22504/m.53612 type:complete len:220 (+) Transcript_22504:63-722(+)
MTQWESSQLCPQEPAQLLEAQPEAVTIDVASLHPALSVAWKNVGSRMEHPSVVEDEYVARLKLHAHCKPGLVHQLGEATTSLVELGCHIGLKSRRILAALCREGHGLKRSLARWAGMLQLQVRGDVDQGRRAVTSIVLETDRDLAEHVKVFAAFFLQSFGNVKAVHQVVNNRTLWTRHLVLAEAVLHSVQELEVGCRTTIRVVRVEADGTGCVCEVTLH